MQVSGRFIQQSRTPISSVSAWTLRGIAILFLLATPWLYGSVEWQSQRILMWGGIGLSIALAIHCILCLTAKERQWAPPWISWLLAAFGLFALIQSYSHYDVISSTNAPPTIQLQRWALGLGTIPESLASSAIPSSNPQSTEIPKDIAPWIGADSKLALSVEPLTTRAAAGSLFLCALLTWTGYGVFRQRQVHIVLLTAMVVIGAAVAAVGIHGAVSHQATNFLGLKTGTGSFATFVSRNTAGAYLNVMIAAALGVVAWTMINMGRQNTDLRYRFSDTSLIAKVRGSIEDLLADLNTPQLGALFCLVALCSSLMISMCRGAAVSAIAAMIASLLVVVPGKRSGAAVFIALVLVGLCVLAIVGLQLDDRILQRLQSLGEISLENEMKAGRTYIWNVSLTAMQFYGWSGSGLGTFHYAAMPFQTPYSTGWFYHAESIYAEVAVELGYLGLAFLIVGLLYGFRTVLKIQVEDQLRLFVPMQLAGIYLLISIAMHSAVDFSLIIPGVYVPCSLLFGAVVGCRVESDRIAAKIRDSKRLTTEPKSAANSNGVLRTGVAIVFSMTMTLGSILALNTTQVAAKTLVASDKVQAILDREYAKPIAEQQTDRIGFVIDTVVNQDANWKESADLLRQLADGMEFRFRQLQMAQRPLKTDPATFWNQTSPVVVQVALRNAKDQVERDAILETIGGQSALDLIDSASRFYAQAQLHSPLDPNFAWGRVRCGMRRPIEEYNALLPVIQKTSCFNPQTIVAASILFYDQLSEENRVRLWKAAMQADLNSSVQIGRLLSLYRRDGEIPIDLLPHNSYVYQSLASTIFTKEKYPSTNRALWGLAIEHGNKLPIPVIRRELWIADACKEIEDTQGEIEHLANALRHQPNDLAVMVRLADRYLKVGDAQNASNLINNMVRIDPNHPEVKSLTKKIREN